MIMPIHEKRIIIYMVTAVALLSGGFLLRHVQWQGDTSIHTLMELAATLLAAFVGAMSLVRFFSRQDELFLYIGAGFLGAALLDGFHAVVTSVYFQPYMPSDNPNLVPWSWIASRLFLAAAIFVSWLLWFRHRGNADFKPNVMAVLTATLVATLGSFLFFATVPLPSLTVQGSSVHRPAELLPAIFFSMALLGYLYKGSWRNDQFEHWLVLSIIVGLATQTVFMPFSGHLYDAEFNLSHLLKKLSYILVLIGLLNSLYQTYRELQDEVRKRARAEDALLESHEQLRISNSELESFAQKMKESEERFRNLANAAPALIWTAGADRLFTWVNETWLQYSGRPLEREIGDGWLEVVHPEDRDRCIDAYIAHFNERQSFQIECRLRSHDGEYRWFIFVGRPRSNEHGEFLGYIGMLTDVSERVDYEETIKRERTNLLTILESLPGFVYLQAQDYSIRYANRYFRERFGNPENSLCYEALRGRDAPCEECPTFRVFNNQTPQIWKATGIRDGRIYQIYDYPFSDRPGESLVLELGIDITDRSKAEEALRLSASVFANAQESIVITNADRVIVDVNKSFTRETGYGRDEVIGKNPRFLKSGHQGDEFYQAMWRSLQENDFWSGELWNRTKSGEIYAELLTISAVRDSSNVVTHYVGISANITHIKQHQKELEHIAHHDALTGLPNRLLLSDRIRQAIAHSRRNKQMLALCYLDLDGFKPINDSMGHESGDAVLVEISRRISSTIRSGDTVARLGGDEFVILLLGLGNPIEYQSMLDRLLNVISQPLDISNKRFSVGASIGISFYPDDSEDADTLLRQADQAMYAAKQAGKNQYRLFGNGGRFAGL